MAAPDGRMHQAAAASGATNDRILLSPRRRSSGVLQPPSLQPPGTADPTPTNQRLALPGYTDLAQAMTQADPAAARQVVRDFFGKCLLGSDFHAVFVTSLMLSNASTTALEHSVRDHGSRAIISCKQQVASVLTSQDLDAVSDSILAKASSAFLDNAMARRLETIPARALVNALARAERLGYDFEDIVEEQPGNKGAEHVVPSMGSNALNPMAPCNAAASNSSLALQPNAPSLQEQPQPQQQASPLPTTTQPGSKPPVGLHGIRYCQKCGRPCSGTEALLVHTQKDACKHAFNVQGLGNSICIHCGSFFTSPGGLNYHQKRHVCGHFSEEAAQQVFVELQALRDRAEASSLGTPEAKAVTAPIQTPKAGTPGVGQTPGSTEANPYGKLSAEDKEALEREMDDAASKYGSFIQEAMKRTDIHEAERELMISRYKNSYNTKQSMIRKKYGIRLRERRPRALIEEDRRRLMRGGIENLTPARNVNDAKGHAADSNAGARGPSSAAAFNEAMTAKTSGGLMASSGTAAFTDPTVMSETKQTAAGESRQARSAPQPYFATAGTVDDPMEVDDEDSNDDSSSDDGDIPAQLASHR